MEQIEQQISSIEVAEMIGKAHAKVLRDIHRYIEQLAQSKIGSGDFFRESAYKDANNQSRPCYLVTKKGCELIAHKLTGARGTEFTARYITRFHELEHFIKRPVSALEQLRMMQQATLEVDAKVDAVDRDLQRFKQDLPLLGADMDRVTAAVHRRGVELLGGKGSRAYMDKSLHGKVFSDIYREVKRQFDVDSYKQLKRCQCDKAVNYIKQHTLPQCLAEEVTAKNQEAGCVSAAQ